MFRCTMQGSLFEAKLSKEHDLDALQTSPRNFDPNPRMHCPVLLGAGALVGLESKDSQAGGSFAVKPSTARLDRANRFTLVLWRVLHP